MSSIDDIFKSFSDMSEAREFIKAQHLTILDLSKKLDKAVQEKKQIEDLLQQKTPQLIGDYSPLVQVGTINEAYEENICKMELKKLHDLSVERILTHEEAKKVEIYTKLLLAINTRPVHTVIEAKKKSTDDLLKIAVGNDDDKLQ